MQWLSRFNFQLIFQTQPSFYREKYCPHPYRQHIFHAVQGCQVVHSGIKKSSLEGLDTILLYLQYLMLVVLQFVEYVVYNGSISLNSV